MSKKLRNTLIVLLFLLLSGSLFLYLNRLKIKEYFENRQMESLPPAQTLEEVQKPESQVESSNPEEESEPKVEQKPKEEKKTPEIPSEINLSVPFSSQAPHANWDAVHEQTCEEASVLMVARFWQKRRISSKDDAEQALQEIISWQNDNFGFFEDTTAEETAQILREFYGFKNVKVKYNPTVEEIKREVAAGRPVIVPAAGRQLPNPNFKSPGPLYHMLVIKGYTPDKFITNDPGTRKGADFVYKYDDLLNAVHDWNGGDVYNGQKVIIVVSE